MNINSKAFIGLMDCNNFFVSCERLFRPDLQKKPVVVLSSNDGCVVSRSQEVKDMGIPMGIPFFQIKDMCKKQGITVFSSNFTLYRDVSNRVMNVLKDMYPDRVCYSIDEAFFTVPRNISEDELADQRTRILQETGIPVSFGVAPSKTLAKIANNLAKKNLGVCIFSEDILEKVVHHMPCGAIWGVGGQTAQLLTKMRIETVKDLLKMEPRDASALLGVVGERLLLELQGIAVYAVDADTEIMQGSYASTRSFGATITDVHALYGALSYHIEEVCAKIRRDGVMAQTLTVIARGSRYGDFSHKNGHATTRLVYPTDQTIQFLRHAHTLLLSLYDPLIPYKKAGVILGGIIPKESTTQSFFSETNKSDGVDTVLDAVNQKHGRGSLVHGSVVGKQVWESAHTYISPSYTTHWGHIAKVKAV